MNDVPRLKKWFDGVIVRTLDFGASSKSLLSTTFSNLPTKR